MADTAAASTHRPAAFGDLEHELASTRRVLERLSDEHWAWRPHDRSMSLGRMGTHLVEVLRMAEAIAGSDAFDLADEHLPDFAGRDELLRAFDQRSEALRAAVAAVAPGGWGDAWRLLRAGQVRREMPRGAALRFAAINHVIHHRGQLTVYLRLLGVPVPGLYGPSADEAPG